MNEKSVNLQSERTEQIVLTNDIPRRLEYRQNGEHKEMQNEAQYGVRNGTQNGGDSVDECCQISLGMIWILKVYTVFPHVVSAESILFWIWKSKGQST